MSGYRINYIDAKGRVVARYSPKAPSNNRLAVEGRQELGALWAIRYWPSRKGWRITDMRHAVFRNRSWPIGIQHSEKVYPTEDAAVMHLRVILASLS